MKTKWTHWGIIVLAALLVIARLATGEGEHCPGLHGSAHEGKGIMSSLTAEQREAVHEKVQEMRERGALRQEIHDAVAEMLKGYGVEVAQKWGEAHPTGHGHGPLGDPELALTDEQRTAIRDKVREMRSQGSTREEIHDAVAQMLQSYGVEPPEPWSQGPPRGPLGELRSKLTDEQRTAIRKKVQEMRTQGATREEIHDAVAQMLQSYGIESPQENSSSETPACESPIRTTSSPNPFNPETQITYTLNAPGAVKINIYNVAGQVVRSFDVGHQQAGSYTVHWDGRNENGDPASSGLYLYCIEAGPHVATNRMILLK